MADSPLWGRTCRASHNELARLAALMPRLAEAFKADTRGAANGGRATLESHGPQLGNGGRQSSSDSLDEILSCSLLTPLLALAQVLRGKTM